MPYSHCELERLAYIAGDLLTAAFYAAFGDLGERLEELERRVDDIEENMVTKSESG